MDNEKQKDEIIALESIYNSDEFSYFNNNGHYKCNFMIYVNLPPNYHVIFKDIRQMEKRETKIRICHLPPVRLIISLPDNYPSKVPPIFFLWTSWLHCSLQDKLCEKLDELWEENKGQEILFIWVTFLQDELLQFLHINEHLNMSKIYTNYKKGLEREQHIKNKASEKYLSKTIPSETKKEMNSPQSSNIGHIQKPQDKRVLCNCSLDIHPIQALIDYNDTYNEVQFKKNYYTCKICFIDKLGEHCTQFTPCGHMYCKECINNYLEVRIKDGSVQNIYCPEEQCVSEATPSQIKNLVSSELFAKYDSILLTTTLDTMEDIIYCPRRHCQYPVSCELNEKVARCPSCQYAFCVLCKMVYHGVEPCRFGSVDMFELATNYAKGSKEEREQLVRCYGKRRLEVLVENVLSENWIKNNSQKCPKCGIAIQKLDGCNKMECRHCKVFFCWICNTILDRKQPYEHFNNVFSSCYNKIFWRMPMINDDENDQLNYEVVGEDFYNDFVI